MKIVLIWRLWKLTWFIRPKLSNHLTKIKRRWYLTITSFVPINFYKMLGPKTFRKNFAMLQKKYKRLPSRHLLVQIQQWKHQERCEMCSKLRIETPEQCHWHCSGVFIVNFEQTSQIHLVVRCGLSISKCGMALWQWQSGVTNIWTKAFLLILGKKEFKKNW